MISDWALSETIISNSMALLPFKNKGIVVNLSFYPDSGTMESIEIVVLQRFSESARLSSKMYNLISSSIFLIGISNKGYKVSP